MSVESAKNNGNDSQPSNEDVIKQHDTNMAEGGEKAESLPSTRVNKETTLAPEETSTEEKLPQESANNDGDEPQGVEAADAIKQGDIDMAEEETSMIKGEIATVNRTTPAPEKTSDEEKLPTKKLCGICNENEGKYKCSRCFLPYCSVTCSKKHQINHPPDPPKPSLKTDLLHKQSTGTNRPGTLGFTPKAPFSSLSTSPELPLLFKKYPNLPSLLQKIDNASLPPADSYTSSGLPISVKKGNEKPWTSDRGLEKGVKALRKARNEDGVDGESVREYGRVVLMVLERERLEVERGGMGLSTEEIVQREIMEEEKRIVEALLNGDVG